MEGLQPYITFLGNCEEALKYYQENLDGKIHTLMHFEEAPMEVSEEVKKKVMHSEFKFDNYAFMAADTTPERSTSVGNNISLGLGTTNLEKTEKWFNNLAKEGTVTMPLQKTFWGATFGIVTDKYGINWMFNCEEKK